MVGPKRPDANVCWCLSYRIPSKENLALRGPERGALVKKLVRQDPPPGVLAYDGDEVVGWAAVHPRADTGFARNRRIPHVDDLDVWSVWCIRVRPGHRGAGISHRLLAGAVRFAFDHGAPAIEGYPVDNARREGRPHDGLRGHPRPVRAGRVHQGRRHGIGARRISAGAHAARFPLTGIGRTGQPAGPPVRAAGTGAGCARPPRRPWPPGRRSAGSTSPIRCVFLSA